MGNAFTDRADYYSHLIEKLNSRKTCLKKISRKYSNIRLFIFIAEVAIFFLLFFTVSGTSAEISAAVFIAAFSVIAHYHSKLEKGIKKLEIWTEIKTTHLARITLDWKNITPLNNPDQKMQTNEIDLDIAGNESLLQLLNTATTKQAGLILREWLNSKNHNVDEIRRRQELVKELIPLTKFRDKLTLYSMLFSRVEFSGEALTKLLSRKDVTPGYMRYMLVFLFVLAPINLLLLVLFFCNILPAYWGITLLIYVPLFYYCNRDNEKVFFETEFISGELGKIKGVFGFLENYSYRQGSKLSAMCGPFTISRQRPSFLINKIKSSVELLRMIKGNPYLWSIVAVIFPIDVYLKLRLKKHKSLIEDKFDTWMNTWYNLESLCSLAGFAYHNPGYTFPEINNNSSGRIIFSGKKLGHPLIKNENKVCNDFSFNPEGEIALVTGSNMSGKSTFMRTLGINLSLAYAGSVVNADKLEVSLFDLFTCIRINDSIRESISFFYAEVKRLKDLLDEIEKSVYPVLFLIDEIFRGTNNVERLKGSRAYIKKLAETNAVGIVATHDLELVKLSSTNPKISNYHFKEDIKDGKMTFDYRLNPGPCPTTNALKIMKLAGLPVEE